MSAALGTDRKPGLVYAVSDEGLELPVIDVTHPAFALNVSQSELDRELQAHMREIEQRAKVPHFVQNLMLGFMMRRSRIMRALMGLDGGFLAGMDTYLLKLGPANMDRRYTSGVDRQISASLPGLSMRLRLQNVACLLADGLQPILEAAPTSPLHLLNIGGGPAMDSLNALIILQKQHADLLARRPIFVHSLDLDESGPHFGARALQALQADGAALHELGISFEHVRYDWTDTAPLAALLASIRDKPIIAGSSEGALFEYASDEVLAANLQALHGGTPADCLVAGSVTRADTTGRLLNSSSRAGLQLRGIDGFVALAQAAGWRVAQRVDRPSGHDVRLTKA